MRILSQDGRIDLPYEVISVELVGGTAIVAQTYLFGSGADNFTTIAEYSTEAKARKAMEMLRGAYVAHTQFKIMTEVQRSVFLSSVSEKEQDNLYGLFQFPTDDEVEA